MINLKREDVIQAFLGANLEGHYNLLEDDLMKLAKAFCALRDEEVKERVYRAVETERTRCIKFVRSLNTEVATALENKKGNL